MRQGATPPAGGYLVLRPSPTALRPYGCRNLSASGGFPSGPEARQSPRTGERGVPGAGEIKGEALRCPVNDRHGFGICRTPDAYSNNDGPLTVGLGTA